MGSDARHVILARRSRFIAAALVAACGGAIEDTGGVPARPGDPGLWPPNDDSNDVLQPPPNDISPSLPEPNPKPNPSSTKDASPEAAAPIDAAPPKPCFCVPADCAPSQGVCGVVSDGCGALMQCPPCDAGP